MRKFSRRKNGEAIAETGPALFVLLILIFFPLLDVLGMSAQFAAAWYLNQAVTRELACVREQGADGGASAQAITNDWRTTGIGHFVNPRNVVHQVAYQAGAGSGDVPTVRCTTTVTVPPFISVPWFTPIPGVSADMTISFSNVRPREDTRGNSFPVTAPAAGIPAIGS